MPGTILSTMSTETTWSTRVRTLRATIGRNVTQSDLARILNVGRATVERWEQGHGAPRTGEVTDLIILLERRHGLTTRLSDE